VGRTTCSTDFPVTPGAFQTANGGAGGCGASPTSDLLSGFVTKLDRRGSTLVYSTYLGGPGPDGQNAAPAVDAAGHAYVLSGSAAGFPVTPDAFRLTNEGDDAVITELTTDGAGLVYSSYWGGSAGDYPIGLALDPFRGLYFTGFTYSTDYPTTPRAFQRETAGDADAFLTKIAFAEGEDRARKVLRGEAGDSRITSGNPMREAGPLAYASRW